MNKRKVLWTQSRQLDSGIAQTLSESSYNNIWLPTIVMESLEAQVNIELEVFDILYLVSQWAAEYFFEKVNPEEVQGLTIVAPGKKTADFVELNYGLACYYNHSAKTSLDLFKLWAKEEASKNILVPLSINSAGKYQQLQATYLKEWQLTELIIYQTRVNTELQEDLQKNLWAFTDHDYVVIASSNSIVALVEILADKKYLLHKPRLISIGKMTSQKIEDLGFEVFKEAPKSSYESIAMSILGEE